MVFRWLVRVLVVVAVGARFFHLSDAPRDHQDAETLLRLARQANQQGRLAAAGIVSTRGRPHGPVAVWTLQLWLSVTDSLYAVRVLQCLLVTALTILGVAWMAHALRGLLEWEAVATILLIPGFWGYSRFLWDNTLLVPLTAAGVGAYLVYCRTRKVGWLFPAALFSSLALGTHLTGLAFPAALAGHFLRHHREVLWRHPRAVAGLLAVFLIPLLPYLLALSRAPVTDTGVWLTRWFAFAWEQLHRGFPALSAGSWLAQGLAYGFGLYGLFWSAKNPPADFPREMRSLSLFLIGMALIVQILARLNPLVHYFNGCWTGYQLAVFLAWMRGRGNRGMDLARIAFVLANAWGIWRLA